MSRTHNLSSADELYLGKGDDRGAYARTGRRGVPVTILSLFSLGTPAAADADFVIKAATGTELPDAADPGETVTYSAATDSGASPLDAAATKTTVVPMGGTAGVAVWDVRDGATYGRNLVSVVSHATTAVAMTVTISGYDYLFRPMTETHTVTNAAKTYTGKKAFAYVTSVAITAAADASANTLNVGTGAVLGLPFRLEKLGHLTFASLGGVQELINVAANATVVAAVATAASGTTGDTRGTIAFNGTLNGTAEAFVKYFVSGRNSATGQAGVAQA